MTPYAAGVAKSRFCTKFHRWRANADHQSHCNGKCRAGVLLRGIFYVSFSLSSTPMCSQRVRPLIVATNRRVALYFSAKDLSLSL